jgi:hypothetical protein
LKRSSLSAGIFALLLVTGGSAHAQLVDGKWILSPTTGSGRAAVATPPKEQQPVFLPGSTPIVVQAQPVLLVIPAFVLSDGTIVANFGMGFEPVNRPCGASVVMLSQPTVVAGNGMVLHSATLPQTAPAPLTASQQAIRPQPRFPVLTAASQTACFSRDQTGRFFVVRQ